MKVGYVCFIGPTNAGKSTLMNTILESKLSIVSAKPQTTRKSVEGIVTTPEGQAIFVDAPGFVGETSGLNKFLRDEIRQRVVDSDAVILCLPGKLRESDKSLLLECKEWFQEQRSPLGLVITKDDEGVDQEMLSEITKSLGAEVPQIQISAKRRPLEARERVLELVFKLLPEGESYLFPEESWTTMSMREIVRETIREKCFELLSHEVPYGLGVRMKSFKEEDDIIRIHADILVSKESHKGIVIGEGGNVLKKIGQTARKDIEKWVDQKIFLGLHVVVRKGWVDNPTFLKELGYASRK